MCISCAFNYNPPYTFLKTHLYHCVPGFKMGFRKSLDLFVFYFYLRWTIIIIIKREKSYSVVHTVYHSCMCATPFYKLELINKKSFLKILIFFFVWYFWSSWSLDWVLITHTHTHTYRSSSVQKAREICTAISLIASDCVCVSSYFLLFIGESGILSASSSFDFHYYFH